MSRSAEGGCNDGATLGEFKVRVALGDDAFRRALRARESKPRLRATVLKLVYVHNGAERRGTRTRRVRGGSYPLICIALVI